MTAIDAYIHHLARRNLRPGTIYGRRRALHRLARFVGRADVLDCTLDELRSFVDRPTRTGQPRAPETRAGETTTIASFFRWAAIEGQRVDNPAIRLERPKRPRRLPRPMPDSDLHLALHESPERIRPWFWLAAYAALRACEIGPLRREDVCETAIVIREQKGGDEATIPLNPILRPILASLPQSGYLFPHQGNGPEGPTSAAQVSKLTNRWLRSVGILHTFHSLRHWSLTEHYTICRDLRETQEFARHRSSSTTDIYTAVVEQSIGTVVRMRTPDNLAA